jgi:hypothetical protein
MERQYSFSKQIKNDYATLSGIIGFAASSLILFLGLVFGVLFGRFVFHRQAAFRDLYFLDESDKIMFGIILGCLSLFCLLLFILRIKTGKYFVKNGLEINAEIYNVLYYRDRGRIEYSYNINGKIYKRGNGIHITKTSGYYKNGDMIKILVDPKNNKKAVIMNHFIKECI